MNFSGLDGAGLVAFEGGGRCRRASPFPSAWYFQQISVGTFTKGLGFAELQGDVLALLVFFPILTLLSIALLRAQER